MSPSHPNQILLIDSNDERRPVMHALLEREGAVDVCSKESFSLLEKPETWDRYPIIIMCGSEQEILPCLMQHTASRQHHLIASIPDCSPAIARKLLQAGASALLPFPVEGARLRMILRNYKRKRMGQSASDQLKSLPFFQDFTSQEMQQFLSYSIVRKYDAGDMIIQRGDPGDSFYILLKGKAQVIVGPTDAPLLQINILPGESIGEMAILDSGPRTASCVARSNCDILEVGAKLLQDKSLPLRIKILAELATVLARRIRTQNEHLATQGTLITEGDEPLLKENIQDDNPVEQTPSPTQKFAVASTSSRGHADQYSSQITQEDEYELLHKKVQQRTAFINELIPERFQERVRRRLVSQWTGSKLAAINPHRLWNEQSFLEGSPRLKHDLHMIVFAPDGDELYQKAYLQQPFTQRVVGLPETGCCGTFLGNQDAINRFLDGKNLAEAIAFDMKIPLQREHQGNVSIEFLTHTKKDIGSETLFLIFDTPEGLQTQKVRYQFPEHQLITVLPDIQYETEEIRDFFSAVETSLLSTASLYEKKEWRGKGFYKGETLFLPLPTRFYEKNDSLADCAALFGLLSLLAKIGADHSGVNWGSKGGAEGAMKAARARYGAKGAHSNADLASAVDWADGKER